MERNEMVTEAETRRAAGDTLAWIADKWLKGRTAITDMQQGSSVVLSGTAERALLDLIAECTADMNRFLGRELNANEVDALSELWGMWRNQVTHNGRQSIRLLDTHTR